MRSFFDPNTYEQVFNPMYGTTHLITAIILVLFLVLIFSFKKGVRKLATNEAFLKWLVWLFIAQEVLFYILKWAYRFEPFEGRFPGQLCAMLSIILPYLLLTKRYELFKFFSYWAMCSGFIAFVNPSFQHIDPFSFHFLQYCIRHYFLFLMPIFLQIGLGFKHSYPVFLRSIGALLILSAGIFLFNWATGWNYMHIGPSNELAVPFLPASFTVWPWSYPSFIGVGVILLHLAYISMVGISRRNSEIASTKI